MNIKKNTYWRKIVSLDNFFIKLLYKNRIKIDKILTKNRLTKDITTILDIGKAPSIEKFENVFIQNNQQKKNITVLSNVDCSILKKKFPEIKVLIGDGVDTTLPDNSFDLVHSSATIEHIGSEQKQINFIKECIRVSKKNVAIITPNRNYFIDFHTKIPFIHLLPKSFHRKLLRLIGDDFFSLEKNLNLLNSKDIQFFCKTLNITKYTIIYNYFMFMKSNIILIIEK